MRQHWKKILLICVILFLLALAVFFFFFGGKERVSEFFSENEFGSFFDIDPQSQNDFGNNPEQPGSNQADSPYQAPVLRQISFEPISGYTYYATTSTTTKISITAELGEVRSETLSTTTAIRFQERATGHVYDVFEFLEAPQKVSNISIPKVYKTIFTRNKDEYLQESLGFNNEQVRTTYARIVPKTEETPTSSSTEQTVFQKVISNIVSDYTYVNERNQFVYSIEKEGMSEIFVSDAARTNEKLLTTVPFTEFTIEALNEDEVVIQTSASARAAGYSYILNLDTGNLSKIAGGINGLLLKISKTGEYVLYSESNTLRPIIRAYDAANNTVRQIGIDTIPEKCVFSGTQAPILYCFGAASYANATYPDDWYKGKVFNTESLFKIDLSTGGVETIYVFGNDARFDVINPTLTDNDKFIIFQNKYDLTLWSINLEGLRNQII